MHSYPVSTPPTLPQILQQQQQPPICENVVVHGSTPLSQIGVNVCPPPPSDSSGQVSPAPTTPGGSEECDSDFTSRGRKQKRGVLPKHATSVMRSWLFQHLVVIFLHFALTIFLILCFHWNNCSIRIPPKTKNGTLPHKQI